MYSLFWINNAVSALLFVLILLYRCVARCYILFSFLLLLLFILHLLLPFSSFSSSFHPIAIPCPCMKKVIPRWLPWPPLLLFLLLLLSVSNNITPRILSFGYLGILGYLCISALYSFLAFIFSFSLFYSCCSSSYVVLLPWEHRSS